MNQITDSDLPIIQHLAKSAAAPVVIHRSFQSRESFFHSLKAELTHQRAYVSDAQLNASVAGYIDRFYNEKRIHSSLGYHSPVEYERLACA